MSDIKDASTIQLIFSEGFLECANGKTFEEAWANSESKGSTIDTIKISELEDLREKMSSHTLHGGSTERLEAEKDCRDYYVGLITELIDEVENES